MNEQETFAALDAEADRPHVPPPIKAIDQPRVLDALIAIRAEANRLEAPEHHYPAVSVRSLATKLGYTEIADDIVRACVEGGFNYCVDEKVPVKNEKGELEFPDYRVCYWGPDQLVSRLDWVDSRLRMNGAGTADPETALYGL